MGEPAVEVAAARSLLTLDVLYPGPDTPHLRLLVRKEQDALFGPVLRIAKDPHLRLLVGKAHDDLFGAVLRIEGECQQVGGDEGRRVEAIVPLELDEALDLGKVLGRAGADLLLHGRVDHTRRHGVGAQPLFRFLELDPAGTPMEFNDSLEARADGLRRTVNLWKSYRPQLGQLHETLKAAQALQWIPQRA